VARQVERLLHDVQDPFGDELGPGRHGDVLGEHDELIPSEAAHGVTAPQHSGDSRRDGPEELVAGRVPERVVDGLEVVEVDEQRGGIEVVAPGVLQHVVGAVEDEGPVREARERVVQRLVADLVEKAGIADGRRRLTGETAETVSEVGVAGDPFGAGTHTGCDPSHDLPARRDGHRGARDRAVGVHDVAEHAPWRGRSADVDTHRGACGPLTPHGEVPGLQGDDVGG